MEEHSPGGSALFRLWRNWRREILRGAALFGVVVLCGIVVIHFFRSFAGGWSDLAAGADEFVGGGDREWHDAFLFSDRLKPGDKIWIRNRSGAVVVAAAEGESLLVVAEKSWRRSSPDMVQIVTVPHDGGVTICALWEAGSARCRANGEYEISNPKRTDVMVRFMVHVPRGVAVDASTVNGLLEITGVQGAVTARTVNGKVRAEVLAAPFSAHTVNGEIRADVTLRSGGATGDVELETVNGSITAALAPGLNAELEASTVNGKIETDYPVAVSGRLTSRRLTGRLGRGGPKLELNAVNGSIRLSELDAPEITPEAQPPPHAPPAPPRAPRTRVKS